MVPEKTQVLVIGGGPAGAYSSTLLARDGFEVTLLERDVFPRYHIGESLLPSIHQFLGLIDLDQTVGDYGFTPKPGAAVKLNYHSREGYTDFTQFDKNNKAYNVVRSEFDDLLLKHAKKNGVNVFEGVKVSRVHTQGVDSSMRPVSVEWESKTGASGTTQFEWLIDASGRAGIISTQHLKNRKFNKSLKNVAIWAYWEGGGIYEPDTPRHNAPYFEALKDESGWSWYIPLHNGTVSVGFVMQESVSTSKKKNFAADRPDTSGPLTQTYYMDQLQYTPATLELLKNARVVSDVKSASDYSYSASSYCGDHYRIAGDAGAFIDPFFSSGVHLAFAGGLSAACTIAASARGQCSESEAHAFHDQKISTAYTRFLFVVLSAYKQIKAQDLPVLQDINEQDFDRAFVTLRPILQGAGDVGKELTEDEVQNAIDFCANLIAPTNPQMLEDVSNRIDKSLMDPDGPILTKADIIKVVGEDDLEAIYVLTEINSRKPIRTMYHVANQFSYEQFAGFTVSCGRGKLGLARVDTAHE